MPALAARLQQELGLRVTVLHSQDRALPDLSRPFEGTATVRFTMDVNGQPGHGTGILRAWWEGETVVVRLLPEDPWWLADRPMRGTIRYPSEFR